MEKYFLTYKPFGMVCQFSGERGDFTLKKLSKEFTSDIYSIGRLDKDSEGLLLLTNDNSYKTKVLDPSSEKSKTYLVQVDGAVTKAHISLLESGTIEIKHEKKRHVCAPAKAKVVTEPSWIPERNPPVRFRKSIPTTWIELTLTEGKNRQVRKMTAVAGIPTLRLIRIEMAGIELPKGITPGEVEEFTI
jgi:23S rRNA pseudouridine2457 synthase